MTRLTLIRHGNADWKDARVADFERSLSRQGVGEAEAMGKLLLEHELVPDLMLASPARRAQQTAEILARKLNLPARRLKHAENLYLARPDDILALVRTTGPRVQHIAIVGHNPGVSELARFLSPEHALVTDLSTGAACTLTFSARVWSGVAPPATQAAQYEPPSRLFGLFA